MNTKLTFGVDSKESRKKQREMGRLVRSLGDNLIEGKKFRALEVKVERPSRRIDADTLDGLQYFTEDRYTTITVTIEHLAKPKTKRRH